MRPVSPSGSVASRMNKRIQPTVPALIIGGLLMWGYFPTVRDLVMKWATEPQYSHGFLVPLFSLYLLYRSRERMPTTTAPMPIVGYAILAAALACRAGGAILFFLPLDALSLVLCITGIVFLFGGLPVVRWCWPALVFLVFMVPLGYQIERMMGAELQKIATISTTFLLQCLGQPAVSEGNQILIGEVRLGVVEACSGLRMLMTFAALSVAAVFLLERHWIVKGLILVSAVPIALSTNILRITATGLANIWLEHYAGKADVLQFMHDFNGYLMPVVGLTFLVTELWVLRHLLIEPEPAMA